MMISSDEEKIRERDSGFRFGCPRCTQHFVTKNSMFEHLINDHDLTWNDVTSGDIRDSDFKNGGTTFETLICDLCDKKKTSVFKSFQGGFVSCSDCTKEKN